MMAIKMGHDGMVQVVHVSAAQQATVGVEHQGVLLSVGNVGHSMIRMQMQLQSLFDGKLDPVETDWHVILFFYPNNI